MSKQSSYIYNRKKKKMKKTLFAVSVALLAWVSGLKAQTIQEGITHLESGRSKSATGVFEKMLAVNPNNIEAIYWLGQAYLDLDEIAGTRIKAARELYEKGLQSSANAPLLLVGMGHVELLENKTSDARQKFETALTMTRTKKGDDPAILIAVGRANVDAKSGNFDYAIEKLQAATDKGEKNAMSFVLLGNAYRKANPGEGGGKAFETYKKALDINPNYALAYLRLAKLFESQKNWELVIQYLNDAVTKDPKFSVAYYELFYYYFFRAKFAEAEEQLKKYIESKLPEKDIQDEYLYAQLCWARKDFPCAVTRAESVVAALGANTKPKVYRLLADSYFQKGDYANAKKYSDEFFLKKNPDDVILPDFEIKAEILAKLGGTASDVFSTYLDGSRLDTTLDVKINYLKKGAEALKTLGDRNKEGDIRMEIIKLKSNPGQRDYFDAGFAYYQGKDYEKSKGLFNTYSQKWPDEPFGWQMLFQIGRLEDTTMEKGLAVPYAEKYLTILEKDTAKNKKNILSTAGYLAQYNANIIKDKVKAVEYFKKMLVLDPTNTDIPRYIELLEGKQPTRPPAVTPKGNAPPAPPSAANPKTSTPVAARTVEKQ